MTRSRELDAQWATVRAAQQAEAPIRAGRTVLSSSLYLAMPATDASVVAAERREAALTITDMAAGQHPCDLDKDAGITVCSHPDHDRDVEMARVALDVLGLWGDDGEEEGFEPEPGPARRDVRLGRTAFTRLDWRWQDAAACRGEDLALFFGLDGERGPEREIREDKAKRICAGCPVRTECLEYALDQPERHGLWGGLNEDERRLGRRRRTERERLKKKELAAEEPAA